MRSRRPRTLEYCQGRPRSPNRDTPVCAGRTPTCTTGAALKAPCGQASASVLVNSTIDPRVESRYTVSWRSARLVIDAQPACLWCCIHYGVEPL